MYYLEWEELGGVIVNNRVTEEIIKIKAKIENGTLVTIRHYKPHEE